MRTMKAAKWVLVGQIMGALGILLVAIKFAMQRNLLPF
jgi:cadmium resistance protein CadD (predicted permease)